MNVKYEGISCQWHCPNCGALVQGIKNGDGITTIRTANVEIRELTMNDERTLI